MEDMKSGDGGQPIGWRIASDFSPEQVQERRPGESESAHMHLRYGSTEDLSIWLNLHR